jgi:hypothetical protein
MNGFVQKLVGFLSLLSSLLIDLIDLVRVHIDLEVILGGYLLHYDSADYLNLLSNLLLKPVIFPSLLLFLSVDTLT